MTEPSQTTQTPTLHAPSTQRSQAKANRRQALLSAAATLFALEGFNRVSLEDLGAAAGVSGPAVYRHFAGKQAVLGALLLSVSQNLLDGGRTGGCRFRRRPGGAGRPRGVPCGLCLEQS